MFNGARIVDYNRRLQEGVPKFWQLSPRMVGTHLKISSSWVVSHQEWLEKVAKRQRNSRLKLSVHLFHLSTTSFVNYQFWLTFMAPWLNIDQWALGLRGLGKRPSRPQGKWSLWRLPAVTSSKVESDRESEKEKKRDKREIGREWKRWWERVKGNKERTGGEDGMDELQKERDIGRESKQEREKRSFTISALSFFLLNMGLNFSFCPHKNWDFTFSPP